ATNRKTENITSSSRVFSSYRFFARVLRSRGGRASPGVPGGGHPGPKARSPHAGAARVALTAIRKNETAQHRNARDPERRWIARARAPRARADQRGLASVAKQRSHRTPSTRCDSNTATLIPTQAGQH